MTDIEEIAFKCLAGFTPTQQKANVARALKEDRESCFNAVRNMSISDSAKRAVIAAMNKELNK